MILIGMYNAGVGKLDMEVRIKVIDNSGMVMYHEEMHFDIEDSYGVMKYLMDILMDKEINSKHEVRMENMWNSKSKYGKQD